ncbi:aminopyrimidine aminohydrolase [Alicyclobacillus contaminans]|uniref:thiaminase II n=1 Tax=Alicyclobacillus contaminans TaxID=392016 RepID=UPI0003FA9495|nr:thiaminase II [Alicyclobacillus contaminans]GMA50662.1 aminopyrimidine aminohydrolase [Alicyclobacillus contaminans]
MSFTSALRSEAAPLFDAVYQHPFVQGLACENVPPAALLHYVQQDVRYLQTYAKVYGLALAKSRDLAEMRFFHERLAVVLSGESTAHENLCRAAGQDYASLPSAEWSPSAHHYAQHLLATAYAGSLGEILAAVLPCHWMYVDVAERLCASVRPTPAHRFYDWMRFYASPAMQDSLRDVLARLDELAEQAGERERISMRRAFLTSCQLEYEFFDMAWRQQAWALAEQA